MRNLFGGVLALLCLQLLVTWSLFVPGPSVGSAGDCLAYGKPKGKFSACLSAPTGEPQSGGWIVGEIRAFAFGADNSILIQSLAENGWVECAGQLIEQKDFPEAVRVLQDIWGSQNRSRTQVYLPDLRGLVLRGWHHGRRAPGKYPFSPYTGDADLASRVFPRPELLDLPEPGIAGPTDYATKQVIKDHVGSMQPEQFHGHRHSLSSLAGNGGVQVRKEEKSGVRASGEPVRIGGSTGFEGGNETHPPNAYVLYLIYLGRAAYEVPQLDEDQPSAKSRKVQARKD